jgi:YggT family protein
MEPLIATLIDLIQILLGLFEWLLIASVILSWLVAFNVINTRNRVVYLIGDFVERVTAPVLRPIRRVMPNLGGIDLSPMIALIAVWFIQTLISRYRLFLF